MAVSISRYKHSRYWALHDAANVLVCLCVYKKGAQEVQRRLQERYAQENAFCTCRREAGTGKEKREMSSMSDIEEEKANSGLGAASQELPPWTPFTRTGQIVTVGLPDMPVGTVWENSRFVVVVRDCGGTDDNKMVWLSIKNADNSARHDWREFMRVKNELVGMEAEAAELYPAESRLVDNANQFHLWCIIGSRFPFGFAERLVSESTPGVTQRPFGYDIRPADLTTVHIEGLAQIDREEAEPTLSASGEQTVLSVELADAQAEAPTSIRLPIQREQKFPMGELVMTPGAATALRAANQTAEPYLLRHLAADWGRLDDADRVANDLALVNGERLLSCYDLPTGEPLWIITEADRASSTILTPDEY